MANNTMLTDDLVADLLAKEASDASIKYSAMGLEAFRPSKPSNMAKPNTRFLGRIIKETASHNAALSAREAAEAQVHLDNLTEAEEKKRRRHKPTADDMRRRQLGAISSILLGRKRQADGADTDDDDSGASPAAERSGEKRRPGDKSKRLRESGRKSDEGVGEDEAVEGSRRGRRDKEHRHGRDGRSRSPTGRGPRRHRHRSPLDNLGHSREGGLAVQGDDPDPPEDLFGPLPDAEQAASVVRARGRGAGRASSAAMDSHFSEDYDPSLDLQLDEGTPGGLDGPQQLPQQGPSRWADAVEAFRDRQKSRQQGAARLLVAGFTDDQIQKWEKGDEKDIDDVKWSKAGERREWDRGKVAPGLE